MQWWIDTIGKIGPLAVAVAVYLANRSQADFQRSLGLRSAAVEDQKWRLALLDRREKALGQVGEVINGFWLAGAIADDALPRLQEALRAAKLVFEDAERDAIQALFDKLARWSALEGTIKRYAERVDLMERRNAAIEEQSNLESDLIDNVFWFTLKSLTEATRVRQVPELAPPQSWSFRRLVGSRIGRGKVIEHSPEPQINGENGRG